MTIASLLRHHGIDVPKYVTVSGRIIFDGVTKSASGDHVHNEFGVVTPVASHTFHGGAAVVDSRSENDSVWWENVNMIQPHIDAMSNSFPGFRYQPAIAESGPYWRGTIDTGRGKFDVGVFLRQDQKIPRVRVLNKFQLGVSVNGGWRASPHLYDNGNLCVAGSSDWIAGIHTAATATAWAAHWLAAYTEWRFTRVWPADGARFADA
ncbi:hypothetical protein [Glutamicibacter protophormiae]|uniref:Type II CBASS E2 protein domain-containing protein n=1 Tax=Glutamicibacter protophormiae TaxID=37930 RepID=A0ABS4XU91_GLUPR|nr:hypothetical protein [Glutamicibacter protophormiae]MBP2399807.1 hypothetical protein [Glutamicibacter protophormiae]GGL77484.1 hypothetical protein GCM10010038_04560 [Glutamicibacter protophormiae]